MTAKQILVLQWLYRRSDFHRRAKCPGSVIARELDLPREQVEEILDQLEEDDRIFLVRREDNKHPRVYRVEKGSLPTHARMPARHNSINEEQLKERDGNVPHVPHVAQAERPVSSFNHRPETKKSSQGELCQTSLTHLSKLRVPTFLTKGNSVRERTGVYRETEREESIVHSRLPVLKRLYISLPQPKKKGGPFSRFYSRCNDVRKWSIQDFVCYYACLYKSLFHTWPSVNWQLDSKAARLLLEKFGQDKEQVKIYMQMAFYLIGDRTHVERMAWFLQSWVINKVIERQDATDLTGQAADRFRDRVVFA